MKNKPSSFIKKFSVIFLLILIVFSVFNIGRVIANSNSFKLLDVSIGEKSDGVEAEVINHDNDDAKVNVIFHKLNDFVIYKLKVKNIGKKDYDIDTIFNDESNPYVTYEYDKHEDETFAKNTTKEFTVKAIYTNEVTDLSKRDQLSDYNLTIGLEQIEQVH